MLKEEIIENNIKLAKMLGWQYLTWQDVKDGNYYKIVKPGWWKGDPRGVHEKTFKLFYVCRNNHELKFNTDFNWIIKCCIHLGIDTISTDINEAYSVVCEKIKK